MCAIVAFAGSTTRKTFKTLLRSAESNGPRSTGVVYVDDETREIISWKRAVSASYAIRNHNRRIDAAADSFLAFGHTRWPTHGDVIDRNAHPFEHEGIIFAHNGVVPNYQQIMPDAVVDSECLGILIKDRNIAPARGSVGLIWMEKIGNDPQMFIYRHSQQLTAVCHHTDKVDKYTTFVASRPWMYPKGILEDERNLAVVEEGVAYQVTPDGLVEAWRNPRTAQVFVRQTIVNGQYVGG